MDSNTLNKRMRLSYRWKKLFGVTALYSFYLLCMADPALYIYAGRPTDVVNDSRV
jgi:hypothetical protein